MTASVTRSPRYLPASSASLRRTARRSPPARTACPRTSKRTASFGPSDDLVGDDLRLLVDLAPLAPDEALGRVDRALGVEDRLALGHLPDEALPVGGERHHRRRRPAALGVRDHLRRAASIAATTELVVPEVDSDCASHTTTLPVVCMFPVIATGPQSSPRGITSEEAYSLPVIAAPIDVDRGRTAVVAGSPSHGSVSERPSTRITPRRVMPRPRPRRRRPVVQDQRRWTRGEPVTHAKAARCPTPARRALLRTAGGGAPPRGGGPRVAGESPGVQPRWTNRSHSRSMLTPPSPPAIGSGSTREG